MHGKFLPLLRQKLAFGIDAFIWTSHIANEVAIPALQRHLLKPEVGNRGVKLGGVAALQGTVRLSSSTRLLCSSDDIVRDARLEAIRTLKIGLHGLPRARHYVLAI